MISFLIQDADIASDLTTQRTLKLRDRLERLEGPTQADIVAGERAARRLAKEMGIEEGVVTVKVVAGAIVAVEVGQTGGWTSYLTRKPKQA